MSFVAKLRVNFLAAARLTPRMLMYRGKRLVRSLIVRRFPHAYMLFIKRGADELPDLSPAALKKIDSLGISEFIKIYDKDLNEKLKIGVIEHFGIVKEFGSPETVRWNENIAAEGDHQLWRLTNCYMKYLPSLIVSGDTLDQEAAVEFIRSFSKQCSFADSDAFKYSWHPYAASQRVLHIAPALVKAAFREGSTLPAETASEIAYFLKINVAFLIRNFEHELRNNHVERNLAAVCLYFYLADAPDPSFAKVLSREVHRIVTATVLSDGLMIERSAMYQALTVMALRIFAACDYLDPSVRQLVRGRLSKAEAAWAMLTHPDGEIALFNDSWQGEVPLSRGAKPGVDSGIRVLDRSGFCRIESDQLMVIFDAGSIGPRWNPGHGHSDFLSVELDYQGQRLFVDPGTSQYSSGKDRYYERSAGSHNGPRILGYEPVEYFGCFRVGRLNSAHLTSQTIFSQLGLIGAAGYIKTPQGTISRSIVLLNDKTILVIDEWSPAAREGLVSFIVPAEWEITREEARLKFKSALNPARETSIKLIVGSLKEMEDSYWSRRYMAKEPATRFHIAPAPVSQGLLAAFTVGSDADDAALDVLHKLEQLNPIGKL